MINHFLSLILCSSDYTILFKFHQHIFSKSIGSLGDSSAENGGLNSPTYAAPPQWKCPTPYNFTCHHLQMSHQFSLLSLLLSSFHQLLSCHQFSLFSLLLLSCHHLQMSHQFSCKSNAFWLCTVSSLVHCVIRGRTRIIFCGGIEGQNAFGGNPETCWKLFFGFFLVLFFSDWRGKGQSFRLQCPPCV